ncbi:HprK-related kinase A [Sphingoaurantiacus capsulatus]|uniref:HprK-related kinase A n=1 Tax=Sphingoaurantiacus capsulatus TaxID=1771310 RepID=A0ABV7XCZ1_9SPHN
MTGSENWPQLRVRVGPFGFVLRSPLREVIDDAAHLYRDYPEAGALAEYSVAVHPPAVWRRWVRPNLVLACDVEVPFMAPVPRAHGLLALEMGMNLQLAAGMHRYVLIHAGAVARGDGALLMTGDSGAGKSTLAAILGHRGWRFLGDEFALLSPADGQLHPFPRPISLKNASIPLLAAEAPADRFGPRFDGTIKGSVQHLAAPVEAIRDMDVPAAPKVIVMPAFTPGSEPTLRRMSRAEAFFQLSQASTNYRATGEAGFEAVWRTVEAAPAYEIAYGSTADAEMLVEELWATHG